MLASRIRTPVARAVLRTSCSWTKVEQGPPDGILGLVEAFNNDPAPRKVSLVAGAYRNNQGKPWVLPSVAEAERRVVEGGMNKEYAGIDGNLSMVKKARQFALGADSPALKDNRVASVQALSGTGSLRVMGEFYAKFLSQKVIYMSSPSWGNHGAIFKAAGLEVRQYRYWNQETLGFDFDGMLEDLAAAPEGCAVLLHACAHNPTGVDPTPEQWRKISSALKGRDLSLFFDSAYQGFASGDAEHDAYSQRLFVEEGHNIALAQSFAKNFGLYGERVGVLNLVCPDSDVATKVLSQLKMIIRPMYSNPPIHGARLVDKVLSDPALEAQWRGECKAMADRIIEMRAALKTHLADAGSTKDWSHITNQIGMFCFSGLNKDQVAKLKSEHNVYITADGRISMAGVTTENVFQVANAIHDVSK